MTPRRLLPAVLLAALLVPAAVADAKPPSCTRGGATLEEASGNVRVVRRGLKTNGVNETRRDGLSACWAPTGKRFRVATERDFGDDLRSSSRIEIVDERYVGIVTDFVGGVSESRSAAVWDAKTRRRLHASKACDVDQGDFSGVDDVAFLPRGGMAMSCRKLLLFRTGATKTPEQLEAGGVRSLAVTRHSHFFIARLYWTLEDGAVKFLDLS